VLLIRVVQSVHAKFHHFDLARQFHRRGWLEAIFTGYPRWKLKDEGIPAKKIRSFPWIRTFLMAKWRYGWRSPWLDRELDWLAAEALGSYVSSNLPECDIFIAISGAGLKPSRVAKSRGAPYICDRGSAHVHYVRQILEEEFARWGQVFPGIDPRGVRREEQEYEEADLITVPSQFAFRSYVAQGISASKLRRIPYGVELSRFRKVDSPPADRFEVLFVGAVSFQKGVPYLLEAFKQLRHSSKRLRVVGGIQEEMSRFLRGRKVEDVEFLGSVPQSSLSQIMSTSHVLVLPSIQDGFGMVLSQAMACGCPVICSTNTGGEDLLSSDLHDWIVPIRDARAITERLERLCQDRELQERLREQVQLLVAGLGGWDDYGQRFSEICCELIGRRVEPWCAGAVANPN
jgi:glycosyltransferase involved in cell wall biosynthesis